MKTGFGWGVALATLLPACAASAPPANDPVKPEIVAVAPAAAAPVPSSEAALDAGAVTANEDAGPAVDPCRGSSFDLAALPKECRTQKLLRVPASLTAALTVDAPSVAPGEEVGVTLTFTNPTTEVREMVLSADCAYLEPQAFKGDTRADYINTTCGFGRGCGRSAYRIALEPGGVITQHFRYRARVERYAKECVVKETPLPPGQYTLRLDSSESFVLHEKVAVLRAPLVVKR